MANELWLFFLNVIAHWQALLTGGLLALAILIYEHRNGKNVSWRFLLSLMGMALFVSCFLAWHDEHHNSEVLEHDKSKLTGQRDALQAKLDDKQKENDSLRDELSKRPLMPKLEIVEPRKSAPPKPIQADELRAVQVAIPSQHKDAPFGLKVTIQSDHEISQPTIEVESDRLISYAEVNAGMSAMSSSTQGPTGTKFRFSVMFPPLSPSQPYIIILSGKGNLRVKAVHRIY